MLTSFIYRPNGVCQTNAPTAELTKALTDPQCVVWVDLEKPTEVETEQLITIFNFHPLTIEDCYNMNHHPKLDNYGDYLFLVLHAPDMTRSTQRVQTKEIDLFLGKNYVVTYHVRPIPSVVATRQRCEESPEQMIGKGAEMLLQVLVDRMTDNYIPIVDRLDQRITQLEQQVFHESDKSTLQRIFTLRKEVLALRRILLPQRDTILLLSRDGSHLISEKARFYFRDVYDQMYRFIDLLETYRDVVNGMRDAHVSLASNRLNEVMKRLTIVATIMLPLTLISGIYGMNFKFMPELTWRYGYLMAWGVMALVAFGMVIFMKRKRWF